MTHEAKEKVVADYFRDHIGSTTPRNATLNWQALGYTAHDLSQLETPFTQEEVEIIIKSMPPDKAPGPYGFMGAFFKA